MREIVFAHTRHWYDSYTDFIELSKLSGFKQQYIDEIDLESDNIYIVSPVNGEFRPHIDNWRNKKKKNCTICYWNLERPCGNGGRDSDIKRKSYHEGNIELIEKQYADYVWISDRGLAQSHKHDKICHMILGSHPGLKVAQHNQKTFDVIHLSYLINRRLYITNNLNTHKVKIAPNSWGHERARLLDSTKFMIGVHQDEDHFMEPLRVAIAAAYSIPYIAEHLWDSTPMVEGTHFIQAQHSQLIDLILRSLKNYEALKYLGNNLHQLLCYDYEFGKNIRNFCGTL